MKCVTLLFEILNQSKPLSRNSCPRTFPWYQYLPYITCKILVQPLVTDLFMLNGPKFWKFKKSSLFLSDLLFNSKIDAVFHFQKKILGNLPSFFLTCTQVSFEFKGLTEWIVFYSLWHSAYCIELLSIYNYFITVICVIVNIIHCAYWNIWIKRPSEKLTVEVGWQTKISICSISQASLYHNIMILKW